ncbi:hypothetical protein [Desulfovibrio sp.]
MVPGSVRLACLAAALILLCCVPAPAAQQPAPQREAVSISGLIVVDDDGSVIIQDDSGVDYVVQAPDLSTFSGEGIVGEGETWTDENGDQALSLSNYEIIDIVITPQEEQSSPEKAGPARPTSARADVAA